MVVAILASWTKPDEMLARDGATVEPGSSGVAVSNDAGAFSRVIEEESVRVARSDTFIKKDWFSNFWLCRQHGRIDNAHCPASDIFDARLKSNATLHWAARVAQLGSQ